MENETKHTHKNMDHLEAIYISKRLAALAAVEFVSCNCDPEYLQIAWRKMIRAWKMFFWERMFVFSSLRGVNRKGRDLPTTPGLTVKEIPSLELGQKLCNLKWSKYIGDQLQLLSIINHNVFFQKELVLPQ